MPRILDSLTLASGLVLPNRLAKTAMTEGLAEKGRPGLEIETVYRRWAASNVGLLITGNVMIDRDHLERPGMSSSTAYPMPICAPGLNGGPGRRSRLAAR